MRVYMKKIFILILLLLTPFIIGGCEKKEEAINSNTEVKNTEENKLEDKNIEEQTKSQIVLNKYYVDIDSKNPAEDLKTKTIDFMGAKLTCKWITYFRFLEKNKVETNISSGEHYENFTYNYESYFKDNVEYIKIFDDKNVKDSYITFLYLGEKTADKDNIIFKLENNIITPVDDSVGIGAEYIEKLKLYEGE